MTVTEIKSEIARLTDIVRYSPSSTANVAAMKICGLQRELDRMEERK